MHHASSMLSLRYVFLPACLTMSAASSSAYYTDIHVRPQLAEAEGDLASAQ